MWLLEPECGFPFQIFGEFTLCWEAESMCGWCRLAETHLCAERLLGDLAARPWPPVHTPQQLFNQSLSSGRVPCRPGCVATETITEALLCLGSLRRPGGWKNGNRNGNGNGILGESSELGAQWRQGAADDFGQGEPTGSIPHSDAPNAANHKRLLNQTSSEHNGSSLHLRDTYLSAFHWGANCYCRWTPTY